MDMDTVVLRPRGGAESGRATFIDAIFTPACLQPQAGARGPSAPWSVELLCDSMSFGGAVLLPFANRIRGRPSPTVGRSTLPCSAAAQLLAKWRQTTERRKMRDARNAVQPTDASRRHRTGPRSSPFSMPATSTLAVPHLRPHRRDAFFNESRSSGRLGTHCFDDMFVDLEKTSAEHTQIELRDPASSYRMDSLRPRHR